MLNVYIDPFSYLDLSNAFFDEGADSQKYGYLKKYCLEKSINVNTIDAWSENKKTPDDVYVSFDDKNLFRKIYWHLKDKRYPFLRPPHFKKRILFNFEPPTVLPEVYKNISHLFTIYDEVYFSCRVDDSRCRYFHIPQQPYEGITFQYWDNSDRKFLVMIQMDKSTNLYRRFIILTHRKSLYFQKDLLQERVKIIEFFGETGEIDLYGGGWHKRKGTIQKVYRGRVKSKHQKLSEYNFAIATENNITPGFIGETIFDCFYAGTVPVYLGAPDIIDYIPKDCFIDMRDFKNYGELKVFLKSLSASRIASYREHSRDFLKSEQYKPFTKEYFAKIFVNACVT